MISELMYELVLFYAVRARASPARLRPRDVESAGILWLSTLSGEMCLEPKFGHKRLKTLCVKSKICRPNVRVTFNVTIFTFRSSPFPFLKHYIV